MIKNPKRYACMPKLKRTKVPSYLEPHNIEYKKEIECYVPVVCYVIADNTNYMPDGTITYNCEIAYTRNQWNLQLVENPLDKSKNTTDILPKEEVSEDYETIKFLCTNKNKELIENLSTLDYEDYRKKKYVFLDNEIAYFAECYEQLNKEEIKTLKK